MGTVIKAKRDGFRRAGIVHLAAGTFYPDGELSESQLAVFRSEPQLLIVEGVQEDALQSDSEDMAELMQEMGDTIASLQHQLEVAHDQYDAAAVLLADLHAQQSVAPGLILAAAQALPPADPAAEGVICIEPDKLAALIIEHLQINQASSEASTDGNESPLNNSVGPETPPNSAPVASVPPATGPDSEPVKGEKSANKRGAADKAGKKGTGA